MAKMTNTTFKHLPNILTIIRIILTFIFIGIATKSGVGYKISSFVIFIIASLTDYFDGYLARKYHLITNFGKIMDPIADKFLTLSAFFIFAQMQLIAVWMYALIAFREISITVWRLLVIKQGKVLAAESMGKYKTVTQIVAICLIFLFIIVREYGVGQTAFMHVWAQAIYVVMLLTVGITVVSGISFLWNNLKKI